MRKSHVVSSAALVAVLGTVVGLACAGTAPKQATAPIQESEPVRPTSPYPVSKQLDIVDDLHGIKVADPYRWLEDPDAKDTVSWVQAQNALTFGWLDKVATRDAAVWRSTERVSLVRVASTPSACFLPPLCPSGLLLYSPHSLRLLLLLLLPPTDLVAGLQHTGRYLRPHRLL